jgi:photosynthetic reaction center cytochrome c subunit
VDKRKRALRKVAEIETIGCHCGGDILFPTVIENMRLATSRCFPPVLLALFLVSGRGQSRTDTPHGIPAEVVAKPADIPLPGEPTGASRCQVCHASEVEGYARSAMAHSLRRAGEGPEGAVSTSDAKITMFSTPDGYWQRLESAGNKTTYRVDYVIGSGNHANGYLVNLSGHLFQSPVAFYKSRNSYDLAPGYEKTEDPDFNRPVAEGCVFCHAGTELHVAGTENQFRAPVFPAEAITCERCHGPSERHLADPRAGTIVNPSKLEPAARDSVCEQCHLMGAARVLNPGREFRDFQAGQKLESTFTTYHDVLSPGTPPTEFKVISHVEQLAMSVCARSSQGRMWCGTCHDPHNKPVEPVQYYRSRCLSCHNDGFPKLHPSTESNCIRCHMPRRDAQDGGHTAFTDHRIQRRSQPQSELPPAGDIAAWREPAPDLQKRNLGIAYLNAGFQRRSSESIIRGYRMLTEVQNQFAYDPELFTWMGTALLVGKKSSEAELAFDRALELNPNSAVEETNAAAAHQQAGDIDGTIAHLERAVAIDPLHLSAASELINLYRQQGSAKKANELSDRVAALMKQDTGSGLAGSSERTSVAASTSTSPALAEAVFKNIQVLKTIPSDQIIPTMRVMTAALGVRCSFCHVEGHFEEDAKPPKEVARSMMRMMSSINQNHFEGTREVTCYSCHRGATKPATMPPAENESTGSESARNKLSSEARGRPEREMLSRDLPTAEQLIDKFIQALGGASALSKITTRVETGSEEVEGKSVRVEIVDKGPDKQLFVQHTTTGDTVTALNGNTGWVSVPGHPARDLGGSEVDAARMDADLQFALHLSQIFPEFRVEYPEEVDGGEAYIVLGIRKGYPPWKFFFDVQSGLLVRLVRYSDSPLGLDPTAIDYTDYREVDGVKAPFSWTIERSSSRTTTRIEEVKQNVAIDDAEFQVPPAKSLTFPSRR